MLGQMRIGKKQISYVPPNRNSQVNKKRKVVYMADLVLALASGRRVLFIDETGLNCHLEHSHHYAPKGHRWAYQRSANSFRNVTVLLATSQFGVEGCLFVDGACDSVIFLHFIRSLVEANPDFAQPNLDRRPLLVLDNVAFHHSLAFKSFALSKGLQVLFTPSYSPMLNAVEFANNLLKRNLAGTDLSDR